MVPVRVHTIIISTQHDESVTNEKIAQDLKEHVIKPVIPAQYLDDNTIFHLIPSGRFIIGGPHGDAGLTGWKIIVDTYSGWVPTVEVPSQEKIPPGWKGVEHTLLGRQERVWCLQGLHVVVLCRYHTQLAYQCHFQGLLTLTTQEKSQTATFWL